MRRAYGPPRDLGPGDLGVRELAAAERDEDDDQELDDGGSAVLWAERDDDFLS